MLQSLHIENIAVIEKTDIFFDAGLTVLTGETGAGKSIVIDAISAVLGERLTRDVVRAGAERAYISATFDRLSPSVVAKLEELGFEPEEDGTLLIQRSLTSDGKGTCRIGGRPATVSSLREIGRMLVNIHGQHENQALLQTERHVDYLDRLGGLQEIRGTYLTAYREYCRIRRAIKALTMDENEKVFRTAQLTQQIEAIDRAGLQAGEEEKLQARRELARHAEKLAQSADEVENALDGNEDGGGALAQIGEAVGSLNGASSVSEEWADLASRLQSALYDVQAVADEVRRMRSDLCFDEQDLAALEDRLALIRSLCKKYGGNEETVLEQREQMQAELDAMMSNDALQEDLERQSEEARTATIAASQVLTEARKKAAKRFETDVCRQLAFLDMPHVRLEVSVEPTPLTSAGGDKVEFLIASNPGEPAKSIAKTASGGELSRVMLALKSVLAGVDDIETMIFDEVDSGISGNAASRVGILMRRIAEQRQVLCVTHLAQIAACGHSHLLVEKQVVSGRTYTAVSSLDEEARQRELARIIGGTQSAVKTAAEMRQKAEEIS